MATIPPLLKFQNELSYLDEEITKSLDELDKNPNNQKAYVQLEGLKKSKANTQLIINEFLKH